MSRYTTKCTRLANGWGCRVFFDDKLVVEGLAQNRREIGPVFRDLLRTLDKMGGDMFTSSARNRINKEGNVMVKVKHQWHSF